MTATGTLRVAVFGATSNIGRHVVDELLAGNHQVSASVRNPGELTIVHPKVHRPDHARTRGLSCWRR